MLPAVARVASAAAKILSLPELLQRLEPRRATAERLVLTNGCFELLHLGHIRYLMAASELGDVLVVGLNSDRSIRRLKEPGRPLVPESQRAEVLAALACVDFVSLFDELTAELLVRALRPEVYVKGGDYEGQTPPEAVLAQSLGGQVKVLELVPGCSTTELVRRIRAT